MIAPVSILLLASIAYASPILEARQSEGCVSTTMVTVTRFIDTSSAAPAETLVASSSSSIEAIVTSTPEADPAAANPTTTVPVSGAGGVLRPSDAADSNVKDLTAVRAFTAVSIKSSAGQCLFIDPTAGDFRENLIPVAVQDCTGSPGEKFDFITSGLHNNVANSTLIVSSLTNGCLNFDPRRTVNAVNMFSCGGRADGTGQVTNSELFPFAAGETSLTIAPENQAGTCLVNVNGLLTAASCTGDASQTFTIG